MTGERLSSCQQAVIAEAVASAIRHDVRNKLASLRNAAYYIRRRIEGTPAFQEDPRMALFFQLIEDELEAVNVILGERLGRPRHGEASSTQVGPCVERALSALGPLPRIEVSRHLLDHTALAIDPEELTLLVRCLLENAVEAMPQGGRLVVRSHDDDGGVSVVIEDDGPGFDPITERHALEAFFSTKPGHAGLGLSIVSLLARRHGAHVAIGPAERGARVEVTFPPVTPVSLDR